MRSNQNGDLAQSQRGRFGRLGLQRIAEHGGSETDPTLAQGTGQKTESDLDLVRRQPREERGQEIELGEAFAGLGYGARRFGDLGKQHTRILGAASFRLGRHRPPWR